MLEWLRNRIFTTGAVMLLWNPLLLPILYLCDRQNGILENVNLDFIPHLLGSLTKLNHVSIYSPIKTTK